MKNKKIAKRIYNKLINRQKIKQDDNFMDNEEKRCIEIILEELNENKFEERH